MKRLHLLLIAALFAGALAAGCNSSTNSGNTTDPNMAQVQDIVAVDNSADPNLSGINSDDEAVAAAASIRGTASPLSLVPDSLNLCWFRHLTHTVVNINSSGDTANMLVTLTRTNNGLLVGRLCDNHGRGHGHNGNEPESVLFRKPFQVTWHRVAQFVKMPVLPADSDEAEEGTRWVLKSTSLAYSTQDSPSVATPHIVSVTISGHDSAGAPVSVTFTDPTQMIDPLALPKFADGTQVTVSVMTDLPASELAFIHFDQAADDHARASRKPLALNTSTNAFEGQFMVRPGHGGGHFRGRRVRQAVWIDVLNKATLRDTDAPYAAEGWGIPYRLGRGGHGDAPTFSFHE